MSQAMREKYGKGYTSDDFIETGIPQVKTAEQLYQENDPVFLSILEELEAEILTKNPREICQDALSEIHVQLLRKDISKRCAKLLASQALVDYLSCDDKNQKIVKKYMEIVTQKVNKKED